MTRTRLVVGLVVLVAAVIVVRLWVGHQQADTLRMGFVNSLTGQYAPYGVNNWNGVRLAIDEINATGGIAGKKVDLVLEDDRSSKDGAVLAVKKLINIDRVPIIIGPGSSVGVMSSAALANSSHVVLFSPGAATPEITDAGDYIFRNRVSGALEASKIAQYAFTKMNLRTVALFYPTVDYGYGFKSVFNKEFLSLGGVVLGEQTYSEGDTDYRAALAKIKRLAPAAVYILGVPESIGRILRQAREMKLNPQFLSNNVESPKLVEIAGQAAEGLIFPITAFDPVGGENAARAFAERYRLRFSSRPDIMAVNGYDAVYIIKKAIETGGYNGDGIKNALYALKDFPGVAGRISFDQNGDIVLPLSIKVVRSGEFQRIDQL